MPGLETYFFLPCCLTPARALLPCPRAPSCPATERPATERPAALPERRPACVRSAYSCAAVPARALCTRTLLPAAPARSAAQHASAPRCPARQRAPLPNAPARPAARCASAPRQPQLRKWAIWWGNPGGGASHARAGGAGAGGPRTRWREQLLLQQLHKRAVRWGSPGGGAWCATTGGPCESTPAGSAAGRRGGFGGGQQWQQRPPETLSPQQLREWAVRVGSPGGGAWGTRTGGVEAPGGVEATGLSAGDSVSAGAEPEEALHTFTLDSGATRCFFRDSTTVTPLTIPVPVTLADPSGGPVVVHGATVLPCLAAPSGLLTGLHLPSFAKKLGGYLCPPGPTLLWHHRLGHPSLPRLRGMHSRLLVSGLPRSLPPLPRSLAPPCLPCIEGRQRAAPHSSSFPLTTAPSGERYFLLFVDDYMCCTMAFPLHSKAEVRSVLIRWIRAFRLQLRARFRGWVRLVMRRRFEFGVPFCLFATPPRGSSLPALFDASSLVSLPTPWAGSFTTRVLIVFSPPRTSLPTSLFASTVSTPTAVHPCPSRLSHWSSTPLPPPSPAPSGVSQVDPPPLVEPFEVSSYTSGPAEGGDQTATDTVTPCRSVRLVVPPGFQPRLSSPPLQLVAVDSGGAGGATAGGSAGGGAGGAGVGGAGAGGAGARLQETLSPERLREWAVRWGSPGGGAWRARGAGSGGAGPGGASAGVPGVGRAGGTGAGGTGATGGTGGAVAVGAAAGSPGSRRQESLSLERLREWAVRWGSPGAGAGRAGAAGSGGSGSGGTGAAGGTGGTGAAGGTRGDGPGGTSAGVPGVSRAGGTGTEGRGATGGTSGAGTGGTTGAGCTGFGGAVATGAGGSRDETTQSQPSALCHLLSLPPAATEFPVAASRVRRVRRPCAPAVPGTHDMTLCPSSVPQCVVMPSPPASSLPHVPDPESDLVRAASPTVTRSLATNVIDPFFEQFELECLVAAAPHFASTLLCPEGDPDALDILTPRIYTEVITGSYSSQWKIAMDAKMAS
ncbi:unnamed protein product [Closterium sp. NIES-54]